ncbi:methyltransferase family protein [uncultured Sphingomonas sp.]|uniref:methyltransferase family protein n=1 Tax=uncultured Sphingomonas sp. TaxID=158754 RepID=UPI0035CADEE4
MFAFDPIGLPGIAAFLLGALGFVVAVLAARSGRARDAGEADAKRSRASLTGVILQGFGIGVAGFGRQRVELDPLGAEALAEAAAVTLLMAGCVALFVWAARTMGRNWSIVARTRAGHALVEAGPFAFVRHPIYVAMALFMVGLAIAFGHTRQLLLAGPLFALGTWWRVRIEEALLRQQFGAEYDGYAARVKRFVPGLF